MKTKEELALELAASNDPIKDIQCPRNCKNPGLYFGFIKGYEAAMKQMEDKNCEKEVGFDLEEPTHTIVYTTYENYLHTDHRDDVVITCQEDTERIIKDIMDNGGFDIQMFKLEGLNPND